MALHCRRTTRGETATISFIDKLINNYVSDFGKDTLGVPLLDEDRIRATWDSQRKHVKCLQDPPGGSHLILQYFFFSLNFFFSFQIQTQDFLLKLKITDI